MCVYLCFILTYTCSYLGLDVCSCSYLLNIEPWFCHHQKGENVGPSVLKHCVDDISIDVLLMFLSCVRQPSPMAQDGNIQKIGGKAMGL